MSNPEETHRSEKKNNWYVPELTALPTELPHHSCLVGLTIVSADFTVYCRDPHQAQRPRL